MITLLGVIIMPSKCISENHIWNCNENGYYCPKCNKSFELGLFSNTEINNEPSIADITATLSCRNGACEI